MLFHAIVYMQAEDLRLLMQKMENWAHRLFPKLQFEEFIDKVERLGKKKEVQVWPGHQAQPPSYPQGSE